MKKNQLIEGQWYWIEYTDYVHPECSFKGPVELVYYDDEDNMHEVESPLLKEGRAWFYGEDFVRQCSPLPTYQELLNHHLRNLEVDPTLLGWGDISAL